MITYYGTKPDGKPFESSDPCANGYVYFAWDADIQWGWWASREGRRVAPSHFHPGMSIVRERRMVTHDPATDRDYDMDEGV